MDGGVLAGRFLIREVAAGRDFGGRTFLRSTPLDVVRRSNLGRLRAALVTDLVSKAARQRRLHENVVISRDQISSNLRV